MADRAQQRGPPHPSADGFSLCSAGSRALSRRTKRRWRPSPRTPPESRRTRPREVARALGNLAGRRSVAGGVPDPAGSPPQNRVEGISGSHRRQGLAARRRKTEAGRKDRAEDRAEGHRVPGAKGPAGAPTAALNARRGPITAGWRVFSSRGAFLAETFRFLAQGLRPSGPSEGLCSKSSDAAASPRIRNDLLRPRVEP
jgi:hypothetical protein